jgi:hypothetical protein
LSWSCSQFYWADGAAVAIEEHQVLPCLFEPKTTSATAGALERTPACHASSANDQIAAHAIARPYRLTTPHQRTTTRNEARRRAGKP